MIKKKCYFDLKNIDTIDHTDGALLSRFLSPWGKIKSRGETGLCSRHQRMVSRAIKRARQLGVLSTQASLAAPARPSMGSRREGRYDSRFGDR